METVSEARALNRHPEPGPSPARWARCSDEDSYELIVGARIRAIGQVEVDIGGIEFESRIFGCPWESLKPVIEEVSGLLDPDLYVPLDFVPMPVDRHVYSAGPATPELGKVGSDVSQQGAYGLSERGQESLGLIPNRRMRGAVPQLDQQVKL